MEDESTKIKMISEFMSPFEDHLTVITVGDHYDQETCDQIFESFDITRNSFVELPHVNATLEPAAYERLSTSQLFRGAFDSVVGDRPCVIFVDRELTKITINLVTDGVSEVDELDAMLIDKYLLSINQEKYVLDITDCDGEKINTLVSGMDSTTGEFNYMLIDKYLAIWIYRINT
jgi:hypothetical protein